jgi:hypothetical protein
MVEGWIQEWYIWYIVRTFVNDTMYLHPAQQSNNPLNIASDQNKMSKSMKKKSQILTLFILLITCEWSGKPEVR